VNPDSPDAAEPTRRKFLELTTLAMSGGLALGLAVPSAYYLLTPVLQEDDSIWVGLGEVSALRAATGPVTVRFRYRGRVGYTVGRRPGLLVVVPQPEADEGLLVLSPVCSHMGCNVSWAEDEAKFACPCHGGRYDRLGNVVSGPPKRALERVPFKIESGGLLVQVETS
jgi:quinol---cytochrome c reductase iron-sulfur subunit, bacillus type